MDGTLIQGDTQEMESLFLLSRYFYSPSYLKAFCRCLAALWQYKTGQISLMRQNEIYLQTCRGIHKETLERGGQKLFDRAVRRRMYPQALATLQACRQDGFGIVLVSATTRHLLVPFERVLQPDAVFCTDPEYDRQGRATGRAVDGICVAEKKREVVKDFSRRQGLDLAQCRAYSDHHSDIPFLSAVGYPHAVNPTPVLAARAAASGWQVLEFTRPCTK